ncbi:hypothetical protein EON65_47385 [archaeon]|nr:MAG: hypothetical protein EON65_47385 [archaeon]
MAEDSLDNWKQFQGTELGGLLGQIYGNQNRPKINYPKPTKANAIAPKTGFIPGGAKSTASDPRQTTRRQVSIAVPKPARRDSEENLKPVDLIYHRRNADQIKTELDEIKMRQEHYRPAFTKAISSDAEKERLNQICTYKGGKGLPEGFTLPVGETPLEMAEKRKERERLEQVRLKRGGAVARPAAALSIEEQMVEQISAEINSLRQHIVAMQGIGMKPEEERRLRMELTKKVNELNAIH